MKYVALLRGINIGKKQVKMEILRSVMEDAGYTNVKTLLASGNVIFETTEKDLAKIKNHLEEEYLKTFGFAIPVILQTKEEIESLVNKDPFKGISVTKETRLYVTFRSDEKAKRKQGNLTIPYATDDNNFRILSVTDNEICSILLVTPDRRSVDLMNTIEKEYGKDVTTRNWNTVEKIAVLTA